MRRTDIWKSRVRRCPAKKRNTTNGTQTHHRPLSFRGLLRVSRSKMYKPAGRTESKRRFTLRYMNLKAGRHRRFLRPSLMQDAKVHFETEAPKSLTWCGRFLRAGGHLREIAEFVNDSAFKTKWTICCPGVKCAGLKEARTMGKYDQFSVYGLKPGQKEGPGFTIARFRWLHL